MNKTIISISTILFLLNMSCVRNKENSDTQEFKTFEMKDGLVWNTSFLSIDAISASDSTIWIQSDQDRNAIISAYSLSGDLIAKGIHYGKGPDEIMELTSIHPSTNNTAMLYDGRSGKLLSAKIGRDGHLNTSIVKDSLYFCDDVAVVGDSQMVRLPLNSSASYILSDISGKPIDTLSYFPPKPKGVDDNTHYLACTGALAIPISGQNLMRTITYDGGLDFFKVIDNKIAHATRFSSFDMDYDVLDANIKLPIPNEKSKTGYSFVSATRNHFYASYSDSKALDNPDGVCTEIHVFNFDGECILKLFFDKEFTTFAVEQNDKALYIASEQEGKIIIFKYPLPEFNNLEQ